MPLDDLTEDDERRINSWLEEARRMSDDEFFKKMIFYWISFNCYYAARYENKNEWTSEIEKIRHVFSQIIRFDNEWCKSFIESNLDIVISMDEKMTRDEYRDTINTFYYEYSNENYRNAFRELLSLMNRVRNRLFHGGKTYQKPEYGNKEILISCCNILENLMIELGFPNI